MSSEGNITVIESFSADDTHALGVTLGQQAKPGDVCTLVGDLGVGKTVLTQGIAEGLGITEPINTRRAGCRFIISMYTGLVTSRRWMK